MVDPSSAETGDGELPLLEANWVTLPDLAKSQKVTYRTALAWVRRGQLKAVKVGGQWRIYESELRRFLLQGQPGNFKSRG